MTALHEAYEHGYAAALAPPADRDRRQFKFFAFGQLRVQRDGIQLKLENRPSPLSLLSLLIVNAGTPIDVDTIGELLWPQAPSHSVRNRINIAIHRLRRQLDVEPDELIVRVRSNVTLKLDDRCWLDVAEFRRAAASGDPAAKRAALDLYCDDLLKDFPWAEWVLGSRDALREDALQIVRELAAAAVADNRLETAAELLRRGLIIDPDDDGIYHQLVTLELSRGRKEAAARYAAAARRRRLDRGSHPVE